MFCFYAASSFCWSYSPHYILYGWNVILPPGVSEMKTFLLSVEIPLNRPPFLDISAFLSLPPGSETCHFEIFSRSPLSQVQTSPFFSKPMCHAPVVQVPRFWISRLINCHSPAVSMETKSPPWLEQIWLIISQTLPLFEKMKEEFLKQVKWHSMGRK